MKNNINPADLVPMDLFISQEPIAIDLVYVNATHPHNIFKEAIYQQNARLWAHKDMASITLLTARILNKKYDYTLEIKDCLRTTEAQAAMQKTEIVKANPHWMNDPNRLLSLPGHGGHPRAMAIDVCVLNENGQEINMGTSFDQMDKTSARNYTKFSKEVLNNRKVLEDAFLQASNLLELPIFPLPSEWWDFRFPASFYNKYNPLNDKDLPSEICMYAKNTTDIPNFSTSYLETLAKSITALLNKYNENI